jgi:NitT/TauT family transport system substrate-binding protein
MVTTRSRRLFLTGLTLAGAAGIVGIPESVSADPAPETTTVRFARWPDEVCGAAPQAIAGELLRAEGFTDVRYPEPAADALAADLLVRGEIDFGYDFAPVFIAAIEAGLPISILTGLHSGCLELIARESIIAVKDLRGKAIGVPYIGSSPHWWLTIMLAYLGLDPVNDVAWVANADVPAMELFAAGEIDAFLAFPPGPQELRARGLGHTVLSSALDRPWSQYYCCMIAANAEFIERNPNATKRALRAILKAADLCASQPDWVARTMVDGGFVARYDYTLEALGNMRYDRWRDFDPADTLRFYALRMHEVGLISSAPSAIIANGTNWRFLNEIRSELKA